MLSCWDVPQTICQNPTLREKEKRVDERGRAEKQASIPSSCAPAQPPFSELGETEEGGILLSSHRPPPSQLSDTGVFVFRNNMCTKPATIPDCPLIATDTFALCLATRLNVSSASLSRTLSIRNAARRPKHPFMRLRQHYLLSSFSLFDAFCQALNSPLLSSTAFHPVKHTKTCSI